MPDEPAVSMGFALFGGYYNSSSPFRLLRRTLPHAAGRLETFITMETIPSRLPDTTCIAAADAQLPPRARCCSTAVVPLRVRAADNDSTALLARWHSARLVCLLTPA